MNDNYKRPYVYRERPYDYRENLIREESRNRKIRKQLKFTNEDLDNIQKKIKQYEFEDFSNYIRYCITDKIVTKEDIQVCSAIKGIKENRKQICFNEDEIIMIEQKMKELDCSNFNLYITTIALK